MLPLPAHASLRTWIVLVLSVLVLGAMALRVQAVWKLLATILAIASREG